MYFVGVLPITDHLPNAHDKIDHRDGVKIDAPECHKAHHPDLDGHDAECDPDGAHRVWDEDQRHKHHHDGGDSHALDGGRQHNKKLK